MPRAESRRLRAKCHRPWAFSETYENLRKTFIFHGSALLRSMLRRAFLWLFAAGRPVVDVWARFGDFGALCVGFGVLFGGFGWPLGAQRLDHGPLTPHDRVRAGCG